MFHFKRLEVLKLFFINASLFQVVAREKTGCKKRVNHGV
jgi:hypothetical protein